MPWFTTLDVPGLLIYSFLGAATGSFLNLCIDRLPYGLSIITPPSHCTACSRRLGLLDLIPVGSYLVLRGRCRTCGAAIPRRVLAVEVLTAAMFGLLWQWEPTGLPLALTTLYASLLIVVSFIDLEHQLILNRIIYPAILLSIPAGLMLGLLPSQIALGGVFGFSVLLLLYWLSRGGLGAGDVKLAALVGIFAGFPEVFVALFIASVSGGLVAAFLLLTGLKGRKDPIPFAPFLCFGAFMTLFVGKSVSQWYLHA